MKLCVERLSESPQPFHFEAGTAWWQALMPAHRGLPVQLDEPLPVSGEAYRMGDDLLVSGTVGGALPLQCSRCLARYRQPLQERFRLVLEPAGKRVPADPEAAKALGRNGLCLGEELESGWYRGPEIDLAETLFEVVALALPVQPRCREDCAGLCSRCGAELNAGSCGCPEPTRDSPFAALEALRGPKTGGES